jgi:hypothetical protein
VEGSDLAAAATRRVTADITLGQDVATGAPITVSAQQLCSGSYVLGVQGVGKSSLLEQIACQLLEQDESVIVFDPHGQLIDNIIRRMPENRLPDTFHLDLKTAPIRSPSTFLPARTRRTRRNGTAPAIR